MLPRHQIQTLTTTTTDTMKKKNILMEMGIGADPPLPLLLHQALPSQLRETLTFQEEERAFKGGIAPH